MNGLTQRKAAIDRRPSTPALLFLLFCGLGIAAPSDAGVIVPSSIDAVPAIAPAAPLNLLEADNSSGNIYQIASDGSRVSVGGASAPIGLAVGPQGALFFGSDGTGSIYKEAAPGGPASVFATGLGRPDALAVNQAGDLFVGVVSGGNIYKYSSGGVQSVFASGLSNTTGLAIDKLGNLFASDDGSGAIYKFAPDGTRTTFATGLSQPRGLAFDANGTLFEADLGSNAIYEFGGAGQRTTFVSGFSSWGFAFDSTGNLYAADTGAGVIRQITPNASISVVATGLGSPTQLAIQSVPEPRGMTILAILGVWLLRRNRRTIAKD